MVTCHRQLSKCGESGRSLGPGEAVAIELQTLVAQFTVQAHTEAAAVPIIPVSPPPINHGTFKHNGRLNGNAKLPARR